MISLDLVNGNLNVEGSILNGQFVSKDVENLTEIFTVKVVVHNGGFYTYSITSIGIDENTLLITLYEGRLISIEISVGSKYKGSPFVIDEEQRNRLKKQLASMGGANTYSWGSLGLKEDFKAGRIFIFIKYA